MLNDADGGPVLKLASRSDETPSSEEMEKLIAEPWKRMQRGLVKNFFKIRLKISLKTHKFATTIYLHEKDTAF